MLGATDVLSLVGRGRPARRPAAGHLRRRRPVHRPHLRAREELLRHRPGRACVDGAPGVHAPGRPRAGRAGARRACRTCAAAPTWRWKGRSSARWPNRSSTAAGTASVIGMTNMPEAKLAREAELCYASVAHGHRLRLLAPGARRGDGGRHHPGAAGQRRRPRARWWRGWPARSPPTPTGRGLQLPPRAGPRADHRARGARPGAGAAAAGHRRPRAVHGERAASTAAPDRARCRRATPWRSSTSARCRTGW